MGRDFCRLDEVPLEATRHRKVGHCYQEREAMLFVVGECFPVHRCDGEIRYAVLLPFG